MSPRFVVAGTDTGIGKTVFSAALVAALDGVYWKPVQAGLEEETDRETVLRLSGLPAERMLAEAYRLKTPASPHLAAEIDGVTIDPASLVLPQSERPLVVEAAGGLLNAQRELYRRHRHLARAGGAMRADHARHHQSQPAVDRGAARA
jgi:dethiobiotin synthetase